MQMRDRQRQLDVGQCRTSAAERGPDEAPPCNLREALGSIPGTERGGRAGLDARRRGGGQQPDAPVCVCGRAS